MLCKFINYQIKPIIENDSELLKQKANIWTG